MSFLLHFVPDAANKVARVHVEPPLAGVQLQASVPLSNADCSDYRASLKEGRGLDEDDALDAKMAAESDSYSEAPPSTRSAIEGCLILQTK